MKRYRLSRDFDVTKGSYGASQMWYPGSRQIKTGCGPAALANLFAWHSGLSLEKEEMTDLMLEVLRDLKGPVVHPLAFIRGARRLFSARGWDLEASYVLFLRLTAAKREATIGLIRESLAEDRPVPLLMGPNRRQSGSYRSEFHNHWVIITAMALDEETVTLEVSSWGRSFEVDLDQLAASKRLLSVLSLRPIRKTR